MNTAFSLPTPSGTLKTTYTRPRTRAQERKLHSLMVALELEMRRLREVLEAQNPANYPMTRSAVIAAALS